MYRVNGDDIMLIGANLYWLTRATCFYDKINVKGSNNFLDILKSTIKLLESIKTKEKWVSKEITRWINKLRLYKKYKKLTKTDAIKLEEESNVWFEKVTDELYDGIFYEVKEPGLLDCKTLLYSPQELFIKKNNWKKISERARRDISECCKCIAFKLPTSAAIMAMRATEDVLRKFYEKKTGRKISGFINWGDIISELKKKISELKKKKNIKESVKNLEKLTADLDYIKRNYRNPVAHPDVIYKPKEAEWLLQSSVKVIEVMIE